MRYTIEALENLAFETRKIIPEKLGLWFHINKLIEEAKHIRNIEDSLPIKISLVSLFENNEFKNITNKFLGNKTITIKWSDKLNDTYAELIDNNEELKVITPLTEKDLEEAKFGEIAKAIKSYESGRLAKEFDEQMIDSLMHLPKRKKNKIQKWIIKNLGRRN